MAEPIRPELLGFLHGSGIFQRILVVESSGYLPELRQMFPRAELHAVVSEPEETEMPDYASLDIQWQVLDYRETILPYPEEFFDYIISDLTLENVINPQDTAAGLGIFLKQTGAWLTSFRNIRHWTVLKKLMEGHFYGIVSRFYAKPEFENLLYASFYKDVRMRPQVRRAPDDLVRRLEAAGFENLHDDMDTEFWLVWAARSMPELSLLKSMYTPEVRQQLSRILHRVEYDVDTAAQSKAFWALYREAGLFPDYTAAFVRQAVYHHEIFFNNLRRYTPEEYLPELQDILQAADEVQGQG